ncbi:hypothetical protein PV08_05353 [Exophiala spinifera]|uniref:DUF7053 domain-containing protein n=1 Tax=Exophiala spinifera TaxID=91928 RepID=A0A0D2B8N8_9EURO|nr:uncharacterized protein PV08_05353 [Exophiala spinifera]KIW15308.1 hypothetical protein PV08_05353 [Exophiala spinifera]
MQSSRSFSFSRAVPGEVPMSKAIACLHEPSNFIGLSPYVISYHLAPSTEPSSTAVSKNYVISDRVNYLPFGLWTGQIDVPVTYTNQEDGVEVVKKPPVGITVLERWTLQPPTISNPQHPNVAELVLRAELHGNSVTLCMVEGIMKKSLESYIDGMVKVLQALE